MEKKRIDYLDGLKGFAAICVFIYHIAIVAFYNGYVGFGSAYSGDNTAAKKVILDNFWASIYTNNSLGLYLFFVMIALFPIISYRKHENDTSVMGKAAFRRYFQLLVPCLVASILNVIFYWTDLIFFNRLADITDCNWLYASNPSGCDTFPDFLYTVFISVWLKSDVRPVAPMWCMSIILIGSLAVYASYALFGKAKNKYLPCIILSVLSVFFPNMIYFAVGSFLAEFLFLNPNNKKNIVVTLFFCLAGLVLVKLPVQIYPIELKTEYLCGIGAGMLIYAVYESELLKKIFSCRYLVFHGKISFEIILIHFFIFGNIGCLAYEWILKFTSSPYLLTLLTFIATLPFTIALSFALNKFVSTPANKLLKKITDKIFA